MRYFFDDLQKIQQTLKKQKLVLFLDFDLTLSPLAKNPKHAFLPMRTKKVLKELSRHIQIVIVTGRTIKDIQKRVGLSKIIYLGSHGLEYEENGIVKSIPILPLSIKGLKSTKKKLYKLKAKYGGIIIEDKKFALALHYRLVTPRDRISLLSDIKKIDRTLKDYKLQGVIYKKTFEVRLISEENKGTASLSLLKKIGRSAKAIYIGDGKTDEDAFTSLKGEITVRVGKAKSSVAKYYVRNISEVKKFLLWVLKSRNTSPR